MQSLEAGRRVAPTSTEMPCVICGTVCRTRRHVRTSFGPTIGVAECGQCGHVFQCPPYDKSFADQFFAEKYASADVNTYFDPALKLRHAQALYETFAVWCAGARRVLEIGGGLGAFARVLKDHGHDVVATEMSATGVRRAHELFGVDMYCGDIDTLPEMPPFDAVVLWDVIEHCPSPDRVLAAAASRLHMGGHVVLTTGNYESAFRFSGGDAWWCWAPDHYHYFRPGGLRRLGERFGLIDFRIDWVVRLSELAGAAEASARPSLTRFLNPLHVLRSLNTHGRNLIARCIWPAHWNIGVMLCRFTKR